MKCGSSVMIIFFIHKKAHYASRKGIFASNHTIWKKSATFMVCRIWSHSQEINCGAWGSQIYIDTKIQDVSTYNLIAVLVFQLPIFSNICLSGMSKASGSRKTISKAPQKIIYNMFSVLLTDWKRIFVLLKFLFALICLILKMSQMQSALARVSSHHQEHLHLIPSSVGTVLAKLPHMDS